MSVQPAGTLVSIFLSVFDVHINRAPISGRVVDVRYQPGKFLPAFRADASDLNEQNMVILQAGETRVIVKQIAGILARRIVCRVKAGDNLRPGERFGLIRFGSRVDILIPPEYAVYACPGQRVRGGESVLASSLSQSAPPTHAVGGTTRSNARLAHGPSGGTRAVSSASSAARRRIGCGMAVSGRSSQAF